MPRQVLFTGFVPLAVKASTRRWRRETLEGRFLGGTDAFHRVTEQIPTVFGKSIDVLKNAIDHFQTVRWVVTYHTWASGINVNYARIPDNEGQQPIGTPVVPHGPIAYVTTLPVNRIAESIRGAGIRAAVSNTTSIYVCYHIFYGLMYLLVTEDKAVRGGFIHIPYLSEQVINRNELSLSLDTIVCPLEIATTISIRTMTDCVVPGSAEILSHIFGRDSLYPVTKTDKYLSKSSNTSLWQPMCCVNFSLFCHPLHAAHVSHKSTSKMVLTTM